MVNAIEGGSRCRVVPQPHKIETLAREDFPMACQFFAKIREPKIGVKGGLHKQVALEFHRRGRGGGFPAEQRGAEETWSGAGDLGVRVSQGLLRAGRGG